MRVVPFSAAPNQSFTITVDGTRWSLALKDCGEVLCVDVDRDGVAVLRATRALAGEAIIPYRYLQSGNFLFLTNGDELPRPGGQQALVYLSAAEMAVLPAITVGEVIAASERVEYLFTDEGFYLTTDTGDLIENA